MFRRFMIACWVLFALTAITSTVSFYSLSKDWKAHRADLVIELNIRDAQTCDRIAGTESKPLHLFGESPDVLTIARCRKLEHERLRHIGDYQFGQTAYFTRTLAIGVLLWNILWHTGHWIWMGWKVK